VLQDKLPQHDPIHLGVVELAQAFLEAIAPSITVFGGF
jgi:hypothetical protein